MAATPDALLSGFLLLVFLQSLAYSIGDHATKPYVVMPQSYGYPTGAVVKCLIINKCFGKILRCPKQCPLLIPLDSSKHACFPDCWSKCEPVCKRRVANCEGYGAVCYDPRFVGGDGIMFYFHGEASQEFCLVSDRKLHINAHFIGHRPEGRTRDFTWVQALGIMFNDHKFSVAAKKVASWDDNVDQLAFSYDGQEMTLPAGATSTWASPDDLVRVERVGDTNRVQITIDGIMAVSTSVVPVTKNDDKVHKYQLPQDDCFAHLEVQFRFYNLSPSVDGVLGQTYQPEFKNPVQLGVPMPVMGGDDKFRATSLFATDCKANKFGSSISGGAIDSEVMGMVSAKCTSTSTAGGLVCRR